MATSRNDAAKEYAKELERLRRDNVIDMCVREEAFYQGPSSPKMDSPALGIRIGKTLIHSK